MAENLIWSESEICNWGFRRTTHYYDHGYSEGKPEAEVTSRVLVRVRSRLECAADERDLG